MIADLYNFITSLDKLNYGFAKHFYCNIKNMYHWLGSPWCVSDWNNNKTKKKLSGVYDGEGKNILCIASTCRILVAPFEANIFKMVLAHSKHPSQTMDASILQIEQVHSAVSIVLLILFFPVNNKTR